MTATVVTENRAPITTAAAAAIVERIGILSNPYFLALENGSLSREQFLLSQEQFYFAVSFFSRPMAALVARLPSIQARMSILANLVDEHGGFCESKCHERTFRAFIASIGGSDVNLIAEKMGPEVMAFNSTLTSVCAYEDITIALGCLGIIEYSFAPISGQIGQGVVKRGWVTQENLVHYSLHSQLDPKHAEDFFVQLEELWSDPQTASAVTRGLELGAYVFDRMYRDLYTRALADSKGKS